MEHIIQPKLWEQKLGGIYTDTAVWKILGKSIKKDPLSRARILST